MNTLKLEFEINVSDEQINALLCAAFNGGINYWCYSANVQGRVKKEDNDDYLFQLLTKNYPIELELHDEDDKTYVLTKNAFLKGIQRYMFERSQVYWEGVFNNHDAYTADEIIQYAVFDKVIYG